MSGFADRLKNLREARGLSQRGIAELLGVDPMQVSRYEREQSLPSAETVVRMAQVFQVSADQLLSGNGGPPPPPEIKDPRLFDRFRQLDDMPKRERQVVVEVIDAFIAKRKVEEALQGTSAGRR